MRALVSLPSTFSLRLGSTLGFTLVLGATVLLGGALLPGCTLITDVDRQLIPVPDDLSFPQEDGGVADASMPPHPAIDAGGAGGEPDAAADAEVPADAGDAGVDLEPDATGDGG